MAIKSLLGVSLVMRYKKGSLTYSNLRPTATDASLYELGDAINSLQREGTETVSKILSHRVIAV
jgi:hypothetical protein